MCIDREFCALPIFAVDLPGIVLFILDRIHPSAIAAKDRRSVCGGGGFAQCDIAPGRWLLTLDLASGAPKQRGLGGGWQRVLAPLRLGINRGGWIYTVVVN